MFLFIMQQLLVGTNSSDPVCNGIEYTVLFFYNVYFYVFFFVINLI